MEGGPFLDERVQKQFRRFVEIRLHVDHPDSEIATRNKRHESEHYGTIAMPYYVLMDSTGKTTYWKGGGTYSADDFLEKLRRVP